MNDAIYAILTQDATVGAAVGTRVFYIMAPDGTQNPFIIWRSEQIQDSFTKDNNSKLDIYDLEVDIYHDTLTDAENLGADVKTALQGYKGTIDSIQVDGCRLDREEGQKDVDEDPIWTQDYRIRIAKP